ncbi:unnamed protein product [Mesocestoides corti]|uniref:SLC26A/SulP transporter domain-containing protein n=1 Tax=Mesocestoides corti TaxID=53468 RepID=A0A3P6GHN5_MESCO|nr:unnamed protein product [Mesocestoides corti]
MFPTISLYGQRLTIISALVACVGDCYLGATTSGTTGGQGSLSHVLSAFQIVNPYKTGIKSR